MNAFRLPSASTSPKEGGLVLLIRCLCQKAPALRAQSLPLAVRETGKRNAEGLSAKLTEGVREVSKIHFPAPNLHGEAQMSRALLKRLNKGQEKSNFPKKVMGMVLTNPPKRGIFITLISTRTA